MLRQIAIDRSQVAIAQLGCDCDHGLLVLAPQFVGTAGNFDRRQLRQRDEADAAPSPGDAVRATGAVARLIGNWPERSLSKRKRSG